MRRENWWNSQGLLNKDKIINISEQLFYFHFIIIILSNNNVINYKVNTQCNNYTYMMEKN